MENVFEAFLFHSFENDINKKMLYYDYAFPIRDVITYIQGIINIPVERLLQASLNWKEEEQIFCRDVFQFSNLDDATYRICRLIKAANNPGVTYYEAGELLLNDGKMRKDGAIIKYGENHLKMAESIGLLYELTNVYFLSCIGYVIDLLSDEQKDRLLLRLILRNKLIRNFYVASQNGPVNARQFLYMLSDSTYARRRSNIKSVFHVLEQSNEYDFSRFVSLVVF